jgi:hypothetical protein
VFTAPTTQPEARTRKYVTLSTLPIGNDFFRLRVTV